MRGGDLDNSVVPRFMVTLDALCSDKKLPKKTWRKSWESIARETPIEPLALGRCWRTADKMNVRFECVVFGQPHEYAEALEDQLDRMGAHPIVWVSVYISPETLRSTLAFRPDVVAVVDVRERSLFWGSRGYAMEDL